jgi:hypothetical protein
MADQTGRALRADGARSQGVGFSGLVEGDMPSVASEVLQEDKSRDDIAVPGWWPGDDYAGLLERSANTIERLISQLIGSRPIAPIEVRHESPAHFEVLLAVRVDAVVQPLEQPSECELRKSWLFS